MMRPPTEQISIFQRQPADYEKETEMPMLTDIEELILEGGIEKVKRE